MRESYRAIRDVIAILPAGAKRFVVLFIIATSSLSILDIVALGSIALILTPMMAGNAVELPIIGEIKADQIGLVILAVSLLMILKSALNLWLQWIATRKFAGYELAVGDRLFDAYFKTPWAERSGRNTAELVRISDVGIANTIAAMVLPGITLPTHVVTFLAVLAVVVVAQPVTAAITFGYLGLVAAVMYWVVNRKSLEAGRVNQTFSFRVATLISEMVGALKEITLRQREGEAAGVVRAARRRSTIARANISFIRSAPRFVLETALIGGIVLVGGAAYLMNGPNQAFSAISLFALAGFRMIPSLTSVQSILAETSSTLPQTQLVLQDIAAAEKHLATFESLGNTPLPADPGALEFAGVTFTYDGAERPAVSNATLSIPIGSSLGLVGSSGAGKSTMIDLILGLLVPSSGTITLGGQDLRDVLRDWRSRVGYVPQDVALFDATIAQNVALTWSQDYDVAQVERALRLAQLWDVVQDRPGGIEARIGERGMALSGGQRQRLGIARALYTNPLVLVLDEATSALDTATEDAIAGAIRNLHGEVTIVSVAHRLSTIRGYDQICFMRAGEIAAVGSFDEVVAAEPEFELQARLAGLADDSNGRG